MTEKLRGVFMRWLEARSKYNEATDETRTELRAALAKVDAELAEVLKAEPVNKAVDPEPDAEGREKLKLRYKSQVGAWFRAAIIGRPVDGREAEYAAAEGCTDGSMPINILEPEKRAITPAPATQAIQMSAIVPALFDASVAPFLGIDMPTVSIGTPAYPYLTTSLTAATKSKGIAADEPAAAFSVATASPRRLTGSFRIAKEDIVKLAGLESALRSNLESAMSDQFDNQVLNGNNTAPNLNGMLQQLSDPSAPGAGAATFDSYCSDLASHIDGLHATSTMGIRALVGIQTYVHMASLFRGSDGPISASTYLMREYGGIRATRRIAAPASNIQQAVVRRGTEAGIVRAPVWQGVEFIRDPYTDVAKGEVIVTATSMIGGLAFTRLSAFVQDSFRLAT